VQFALRGYPKIPNNLSKLIGDLIDPGEVISLPHPMNNEYDMYVYNSNEYTFY